MDVDKTIPVEDEIEVSITSVNTLINKTKDINFLREILLNSIKLEENIRKRIGVIISENNKTHELCEGYITSKEQVIYGYGTVDIDGWPSYVCMECTRNHYKEELEKDD